MRAEAQAHIDQINAVTALLRRFLDWDRATKRLEELNARVEDSTLWDDPKAAQELMREHAQRTTMAIMIATALHTIAFGNMLPSYVIEKDGPFRPLTTIAVDSSEFVVSKLKDRGTHQAFGVITNAQDFLHVLRYFVEAETANRATSRDYGRSPVHAASGA